VKFLVLLALVCAVAIPIGTAHYGAAGTSRAPFEYRPVANPAEIILEDEAMASKVLTDIPAFSWTYGCSATSAGMIFGYYDRHGYPDFYTGPKNGGVCPLTNPASIWPRHHTGTADMPMIASHLGQDGRTIKGHVDDFWTAFGSGLNDCVADCHTPDSIADFMGTNQKPKGNTDGSTTFYSLAGGSPLYDYTSVEVINRRDGCHGLHLFAEDCGYSVLTNYTQRIAGYNGVAEGFTLEMFKAEIDAGYPVMIQVEGHSMVGFGYTESTIYILDTWDFSQHSMTWGGSYSGMLQWGVTVIHLAPIQGTVGLTIHIEMEE
jgi:hypothetical protein